MNLFPIIHGTMKKIAILILTFAALSNASAQQFMTRTGKVTFFSKTPVENIEAINNETACSFNPGSGDLRFIVPIKSFKFEKALMQEHFNENYLESDKFPKAEFNGKIANPETINLSKDGVYPANAVGKLTIHGVTRTVTIPGTITIKDGKPVADATFNVRCYDYEVKIPSVVSSKIAEEIKVTVSAQMSTGR
jgi:hypothetical protein